MGKQLPVNRDSLEHWIAALELHGSTVKREGGDSWRIARLTTTRRQAYQSSKATPQPVVVTCFAGCEFDEIRAALDFGPHNGHAPITPAPRRPATPEPPPKKPQRLPDGPHHTTYYYSTDGRAVMAFAVQRRATPTGKTFSQWTPVNDGLWLSKGLEDDRPLYLLPDIAKSTGKVAIVEGEKCVEAMRQYWPGRLRPHGPAVLIRGKRRTGHR